jgi:hypothetical protein
LFCFVGLEKLWKDYCTFSESSRFLVFLFITPCHGKIYVSTKQYRV